MKELLRAVRALKDHGCPQPWRLLWIVFRSRWLPHREYTAIDEHGISYLDDAVMPVQWVWRRRVLWFRPGSGGRPHEPPDEGATDAET
jgi:hypothetical protein